MTFVPCSTCGAKPKGKLYWTAWVWYLADQTRLAYRLSLCKACFDQHVVGHVLAAERSETLICPNCGGASDNDLDGLYLTVAAPGSEKRTFELAYDAGCAGQIHGWVIEHGSRLEDRSQGQGPGSRPLTEVPAFDVWSALGLRPRE